MAIFGIAGGIISIIMGIIIIAWPRIIAYVIGIYLVLVGIISLVITMR